MKFLKVITSTLLLLSLLFSTGCFVTKAGNYVVDKSKSAYSATKSALGLDKEDGKSSNKKSVKRKK